MSFLTGFGGIANQKDAVWQKGRIVLGRSAGEWRMDEFGNLIRYQEYGSRVSAHGWEIDHIVPEARGGSDNISNLRPLHWKANASRGGRLATILTGRR